MNSKIILKYTFSILLLLGTTSLFAQKNQTRQFFVRPGIDLSRFAMPYFNQSDKHSGIELNLDSEIKYRFFPVAEAGIHSLKKNTETYHYQSSGNYMRLGLNYNMLNYRQRFDRNIFYIGFRIGVSKFSYQAPYIAITNSWGTYESSMEKSSAKLEWFEGVMGLKGEILPNIYLSYTFRVKHQISHSNFDNFVPYWIPGYGKGALSRVMGMSYSISYAIPIKNPKPDFEN